MGKPKHGYRPPFKKDWHRKAIKALELGSSYRQAAKVAGVTELGLLKWLAKLDAHHEHATRSERAHAKALRAYGLPVDTIPKAPSHRASTDLISPTQVIRD